MVKEIRAVLGPSYIPNYLSL